MPEHASAAVRSPRPSTPPSRASACDEVGVQQGARVIDAALPRRGSAGCERPRTWVRRRGTMRTLVGERQRPITLRTLHQRRDERVERGRSQPGERILVPPSTFVAPAHRCGSKRRRGRSAHDATATVAVGGRVATGPRRDARRRPSTSSPPSPSITEPPFDRVDHRPVARDRCRPDDAVGEQGAAWRSGRSRRARPR